jgi:hypothetical protein
LKIPILVLIALTAVTHLAVGLALAQKGAVNIECSPVTQGDSVVTGPKLLSIQNYVIEIMT